MTASNEDPFLSFGDLIRTLAPIRDRGARTYLLAEKLLEMDDERAACFLEWICSETRRKERSEFALIHNAVVDLCLIPQRLGVPKRRGIQSAARDMGFADVADMLGDHERANVQEENVVPMTLPAFKGVTLGERKAMARGSRMRWLEQLLHDQDPAVIRNLLVNPRITEREVLKLASKTPTSPEVLKEVAKSPRWISRYRVKKALVLNPHTPFVVSAPLLDSMLIQDLRLIWKTHHLKPALRKRARQLCDGRRSGINDGPNDD